MHDDDTPIRPAQITDGNGTVWTWRGQGYAVKSIVSDVDWRGRPWTTSEATIRAEWPDRKVKNAGKAGGTLTPKGS